MNKCIPLILLLTLAPLFAMEKEEDSADFLKELDAFEKMLEKQGTRLAKQAYEILKNNSCSTQQETERKCKALQFLFTFNASRFDAMKLIRVEKNRLIFKGNCEDTITGKDFEAIEQGNFSVDLNEISMHPGPRLIIGRKTVPTIQEYSNLAIPHDTLPQWTDNDTARAFGAAIEKTMK